MSNRVQGDINVPSKKFRQALPVDDSLKLAEAVPAVPLEAPDNLIEEDSQAREE